MSVHVMCMKCDPLPTGEALPADAQPLPLGSRDEVRTAVEQTFAAIIWDEWNCGHFESESFWLLFSLGRIEPVMALDIQLGGPTSPMPSIFKMAKHQGWALLNEDGELLWQS